MEVSSSQQMHVFLLFITAGMACGMLFDIQRFFRRLFYAGNTRTMLEDILFTTICISIIFWFSYHFNNGEMRYYQLMGIASGVLFYASVLSRVFMKILSVIFAVIRKIIINPLVKICLILMIPIRKFAYITRKLFAKIKRKLRSLERNVKKKRKLLKKRVKML